MTQANTMRLTVYGVLAFFAGMTIYLQLQVNAANRKEADGQRKQELDTAVHQKRREDAERKIAAAKQTAIRESAAEKKSDLDVGLNGNHEEKQSVKRVGVIDLDPRSLTFGRLRQLMGERGECSASVYDYETSVFFCKGLVDATFFVASGKGKTPSEDAVPISISITQPFPGSICGVPCSRSSLERMVGSHWKLKRSPTTISYLHREENYAKMANLSYDEDMTIDPFDDRYKGQSEIVSVTRGYVTMYNTNIHIVTTHWNGRRETRKYDGM